MEKSLALEWLHDTWMMRAESIDFFAALASDVLLGKTVPTGFFGSLTLPDVPKNMALVVMNGPLTKSDVCGWKGSRSISNEIAAASKDNSIDAIILLSENCPGGQVDGTQALSNAVVAAKEKKPVIGVVSGMACSAAIWALAECNAIYATSETDMIGCIGTMARLKNPKTAKEGDYIEIVSDLSPDKNSETKDPELFKSSYLNPVTESFHNTVKNGRGDKLKLDKENVLSGKTYVATHALQHGLIDGILPFDSVVKQTKKTIKDNNKNSNTHTMKFSEQYPKLAAVLGTGISADANTADITIDAFLPHCAALEAVITERDANAQTVSDHAATISAKDVIIGTLTTEKTALETKVVKLEKKDGAIVTSTSEQEETAPPSKEVDANAMGFQAELYTKI